MIAFLILALGIVLAGVFSAVKWVAVVGTVLLCVAYVLALSENRRRRRRKRYVPDKRWA